MTTFVDALGVLIEHLGLCWKAEEENAQRLTVRFRMLLTANFGFFGLALLQFALAPLRQPLQFAATVEEWQKQWIVWSLSAGLVSSLISTVLLFGLFAGQRTDRASSAKLLFDKRFMDGTRHQIRSATTKADPNQDAVYRAIFFQGMTLLQMEEATRELSLRNDEEKRRLDWSQLFLLLAVVGIASATVMWVYTHSGS